MSSEKERLCYCTIGEDHEWDAKTAPWMSSRVCWPPKHYPPHRITGFGMKKSPVCPDCKFDGKPNCYCEVKQ